MRRLRYRESPVVSPVVKESGVGSKAPALPPRRKHVVVKKEEGEKKKVEEGEKKEVLRRAAEEALAATAAAAAVHDVAGTVANAERVSDIVDDQLRMAKEEAIEAVVEIVEAEDVAEQAVVAADEVIEASKAEREEEEKEEEKRVEEEVEDEVEVEEEEEKGDVTANVVSKEEKNPFLVKNGPPKKKKKKKKGEVMEPVAIEHVFTVEDLRGKTLSGKTTTEDKSQPLLAEEADEEVESLDAVEHPQLSFENAPDDKDENVGKKEKEIRDMIVDAHRLANEAVRHAGNPQLASLTMRKAVEKAQDALDLCVRESQENGNIRPSLIAATAFCLADVKTHAYGGRPPVNELKVAFAVALDAISHSGDSGKGGRSKAYTQFGAVMNQQQKPRSALASYMAAYEAAKADYGDVHQMVEQAKYDYTGYLAKCGRSRECVDFLVAAAKSLQEKADVLEAEAHAKEKEEGGGEKEEKREGEEVTTAGDEDNAEVKTLPVYGLARHFAMRNLLNAAGVLDTRGEHVESQELLADVLELAIRVHGENSPQHMNALYAVGTHCKVREAIEEAIACHEAVLNIMDATIQVYDPELLQNRVAILKDTAQLYDLQGKPEFGIEYAEGACVNAQTLANIYAQLNENFPLASRIGMLEPFWQLLVDLKTKVGDTKGAQEARRELNKGRLNLTGMTSQGQRGARPRRAPRARR